MHHPRFVTIGRTPNSLIQKQNLLPLFGMRGTGLFLVFPGLMYITLGLFKIASQIYQTDIYVFLLPAI